MEWIKKERIDRREFLKLMAASAAGAALSGIFQSTAKAKSKYPHWGKVVVVRHDKATEKENINQKIVKNMLHEAIGALTGGEGWPSLFPNFKRGETVAIKVNCIARRMSTHWEVVEEIINGLKGVGFRHQDIVVYDTFAFLIKAPKYELKTEPGNLRVMGTDQLKDPYDQNKPFDMQGEPAYLSRILTEATYVINVPVLKEHFEAGLTFALKNHVGSVDKAKKLFHEDPEPGNFIHAFLGRGKPKQDRIALINAAPDIREKTKLIVGDALLGIYQRGPDGPPQFAYHGLIIGTDPVAVDYQGRMIINEERTKRDLPPIKAEHIEIAAQLGLGAPNKEVKVIGLHQKGA
ncbi:MAG: DUF362 domain-containing protein [Thermodesulfobacteriota bacterium]